VKSSGVLVWPLGTFVGTMIFVLNLPHPGRIDSTRSHRNQLSLQLGLGSVTPRSPNDSKCEDLAYPRYPEVIRGLVTR